MVGNVAKMVDRLSKVDMNRPHSENQSKNLQLHHALFAYKSQQTDELSLEVDDVIEILARIEEGWNKGKLQRTGQIGMYPTNYCEDYKSKGAAGGKSGGVSGIAASRGVTEAVERLNMDMNEDLPEAKKRLSAMDNPSKSSHAAANGSSAAMAAAKEDDLKEYAKVTFVYEAQHNDELTLSPVGALVLVTNKETGDPGWYEGQLDGKKGLFPDNFVELIRVPQPVSSVSPSVKPTEKPPASLPGAVLVMNALPPQVPAKPPKNVLSASTTSLNSAMQIGNGTPATTTPRPLTTVITNNNNNTIDTHKVTAKAADGEKKESASSQATSFTDKKAAIFKNLNMMNPSSVPSPSRPTSSSSTNSIVNMSIVTQSEPAGPSLLEPAAFPLEAITKKRNSGPIRRPPSMLPSKGNSISFVADPMSKSEIGAREDGASVSPVLGYPASSPSTVTTTVPTAVLTATAAPIHRLPLNSISRTEGATTVGGKGSPVPADEWVSRKEYNELLAKIAKLEERILSLERKNS